MTRTRTKRAAAVLGIVATAVLMASPASADVVVNESYEFAYSQVIDDHCDVEGFTVEQSGVVEGRFRIIARGPNGFEYAADTARFADTWTNVDTGESVTDAGLYNGRDLSITDNGDGTRTVVVQYSGAGGNLVDADGDRIAHTAGLIRLAFIVDESFDVIERIGIFKSTGTSSDFCAALVQAIG